MRAALLGLLMFGNDAVGLTIQKRFPASTYQVKESHYVPRSWSRVGAAPVDHTITLRIGLTQSRFDELKRNLYEGKTTEPHFSHETLGLDLHAFVRTFRTFS